METTMETTMVAVRYLVPRHEVTDEDKLAELTASMERDGWQGAPLVGWGFNDDLVDEVWLVNGVHRLAAAKAAGLETVPVVLLDLTYEQLEDCGAIIGDLALIGDAEAVKSLLQEQGQDELAALIPWDGDRG